MNKHPQTAKMDNSFLHFIETGDPVKIVQDYLEKSLESSVNGNKAAGSALHLAYELKSHRAFSVLANAVPTNCCEILEAKNSAGLTILQVAAINNDVDSCVELLKRGANASVEDAVNGPLIFIAIRLNNLAMFNAFFEHCPKIINTPSAHGVYPLQFAYLSKAFELFEHMITLNGIDLNCRDDTVSGLTCLHLCSLNIYTERYLKLLLEKGANPNICDKRNLTPLDLAIINSNYWAVIHLVCFYLTFLWFFSSSIKCFYASAKPWCAVQRYDRACRCFPKLDETTRRVGVKDCTPSRKDRTGIRRKQSSTAHGADNVSRTTTETTSS